MRHAIQKQCAMSGLMISNKFTYLCIQIRICVLHFYFCSVVIISVFFFRDHYFDKQARAKNNKEEKTFNFEGANVALKEEQPVKQQYGYRINSSRGTIPSRIKSDQKCTLYWWKSASKLSM